MLQQLLGGDNKSNSNLQNLDVYTVETMKNGWGQKKMSHYNK